MFEITRLLLKLVELFSMHLQLCEHLGQVGIGLARGRGNCRQG